MAEQSQSLGFIGVGVMGGPMCRNLTTKSGAAMIAYDPNSDALAALADVGVRMASSVAEVVGASDVVFLSLPGGPQLQQVCEGAEGLLEHARAGQTIVDTSTAPVQLTRRLAQAFGERRVAYADAPIARTRKAAQEGTLSIMVGASAEVFETVRPWLAFCGTDITHCGNVGCGQIAKLLNNLILFQNVVAIGEALSVGRRSGIDPHTLCEVLSKGSADSFALRNHGMKAMLPGTFPEHAFSTVYAQKDLAYALELAADAGLSLRGAAVAEELLEDSRQGGNADLYFPALLRVIDRI